MFQAQYIIDNSLGGAMFWDITMDDFTGACDDGINPIINRVREILG